MFICHFDFFSSRKANHLMLLRICCFVSIALAGVLPVDSATSTSIIDISGPSGSGAFGSSVAALPNGNFVVTDPTFSPIGSNFVSEAGAVFLYGPTGQLISMTTGRCPGDNLGSGGITVLPNGNFVVSSPNVDRPVPATPGSTRCIDGSYQVTADTGAVSLIDGSAGVAGHVSPANSLMGSHALDRLGRVSVLPDSNYLILGNFWNDGRGAVMWRSGATFAPADISPSNSVLGETVFDNVGEVKILPNGNYVIYAHAWNAGRGAVRYCLLTEPCTGPFTPSNSMVGSNGTDHVSSDGIVVLPNSNYVIVSRSHNNSRGAVTFINTANATTGVVGPDNSLVGTVPNDFVGNLGVTPLASGGYVVLSNVWSGNFGAATYGNPQNGTTGEISAVNSLVGTASGSFFQAKVVRLSNGNYVVAMPNVIVPGTGSSLGAAVWADGDTGVAGSVSASNSLYRGVDAVVPLTSGNYVVVSRSALGTGAVTFGNGTTGITGAVSAANSLVGSTQGDSVGFSGGFPSVTALANGNYVVSSSSWDNGNIQDAGAVTLCDGVNGTIGVIGPSNSLVGSSAFDQVGFGSSVALVNGNYVVRSYLWNNGSASRAGAVTFGSGATGVTGPVTPGNSLVGTNSGDNVGINNITALPNGNYVVTSFAWSNKGAVTFGNGTVGVGGPVSAQNSVVGSTQDDRVGTHGNDPSIKAYPDGTYAFLSANWDNLGVNDAGAVTLGRPSMPVAGEIGPQNSIRGTGTGEGTSLVFDYSQAGKYLVVGRPGNRTASIIKYESTGRTLFDFDGDGKTDVGIFRPGSSAEWWISRSSDNGVLAAQFGAAGDQPVPADYTGDGKSDIAFFRPSTGTWFVLRSEDFSFYGFPFGSSTDVPAPADFDGNGKSDPAVFRDGTWYILRSSDGGVTSSSFGVAGDKPVASDYDGDGRADIGIYRPNGATGGEWWIMRSTAGLLAASFGSAEDKTTAGDYTGDGKADCAFFRPSTGTWYVLRSEDMSFYGFPFGNTTDAPAPGDYDGDSKTDAAVFRSSGAAWFVNKSSGGVMSLNFGAAGDQPVPGSFVR
jgi:hypothetical protein